MYGSLKLFIVHVFFSFEKFLQGINFGENDKLENRKLLWHGTNVAVVTAILKTGLRIMPHSGGRVGRGIYFASEHNKSRGYGEMSLITQNIFVFIKNTCTEKKGEN